jgi:hypothetical protein
MRARIGDRLEPGAPLAEIHARDEAGARQAGAAVRAAFVLSADPVAAPADAYEVIGG